MKKSAVQLCVEKTPSWIKNTYLLLYALLPWTLEFPFGASKLDVPGEPLIVLLGIGTGWPALRQPGIFIRLISGNAVLKIGAVWIAWLGVSAGFSVLPLVSWKYWVVEAGHWWVLAVGLAAFPGLWRRCLSVFLVSMCGMVVYALLHHAFYHFRADQALLAPMPFFPENTLYAAVLAMVLFLQYPLLKTRFARWSAVFSLFPVAGLFFSFGKAAWISVLIAAVAGTGVFFREKRQIFVAGTALATAAILFFSPAINAALKRDVSWQERLNRYACALRMSADRPWTGFGPGTFQFHYVPYQRPEQMTRISARAPVGERSPDTYGRGGGAHSEFFQALAENGLPGIALFVLLAFVMLMAGIRAFQTAQTRDSQLLALAVALALLTFFLHGMVNNLLHDGRMAALVWGTAGQLAAGSGSRQ